MMKVYRYNSPRRTEPTYILDIYEQFEKTLEDFKKLYKLWKVRRDDFRAIADGRLSLFKDKTRLHLSLDPMTADLRDIFAEWVVQRPGFALVREHEIRHNVICEEFIFLPK